MKIGYFADGPWAHKALEKIVESNHFEIVFIVPRFDTQDPKLKIWADRLGVPFLTIENVNDPSFIEYLKKFLINDIEMNEKRVQNSLKKFHNNYNVSK